MPEPAALLWSIYWILILGSALVVASLVLIAIKKGDSKYVVSFAVFGLVLILSPFYTVKELSPTGAKFESGGMISSIFKNAETKPKLSVTDASLSTKQDGPAPKLEGRSVLVAYRAVRLDDAKILFDLLKAAGLSPILANEPLTSPRINIQYPSGIVRIVYKNQNDKQLVERIFEIIQYYRSEPDAEIAIGGPYDQRIQGTPIQILLY